MKHLMYGAALAAVLVVSASAWAQGQTTRPATAAPTIKLPEPSTEATQACERLTMVHTSAENAKRGIGGSRLGCASVPKRTEVRLITHEGDVAQVFFCTVDGCLRRWLLMSVLGPNGI